MLDFLNYYLLRYLCVTGLCWGCVAQRSAGGIILQYFVLYIHWIIFETYLTRLTFYLNL